MDTGEQLRVLWPALARERLEVLLQELIPGPETRVESYHVYVDATGAVAGEFTGRKLRTAPAEFGETTALEITSTADVADLGRDLTRRLGLRGVAKFDFKRDDDGRLHLLEVNPRFNLWHHPGAKAGVNLPALVYADLAGLPRPPAGPARPGVRWVYHVHDARAARRQGVGLGHWLAWARARGGEVGRGVGRPAAHGAGRRGARRREGRGRPTGAAELRRRVRYGVFSDVHANLPALHAVLETLDRAGVDAYACAGDLVGYGPQPDECVDVVRRLGAACVAGNHDLIAVGTLSEDRCERLARESLRWTRAALGDGARAYLADLPRRIELPGGLVIAHGSLDDPQEYVLRADQAAAQLRRLEELYPAAPVLVLGHTHRALACDGGATVPPRRVELGTRRWVLNPGAVGQSREPLVRARCLVLDLERREVTFHAVRYDVRRTRALLRRHGRPAGSVHLPPWRLKAVLRPAVRAVRRAQSGLRRP